MKNETIAVVIATYNGEKYLKQQVDSLLNQTYKNIKIYLHDDNSKDKTFQIISELSEKNPNKIVKLDYPAQGGAAANFLSMLKYVDEPYVMFCDQDDVWLEEKIEVSYNKIVEMEEKWSSETPCTAFTDLKIVDSDLNIISESFMKYTNHNPYNTKCHQLLVKNVTPGCAMILNKALMQLAMKYNDVKKLQMHDRWALILASIFGKVEFIDKSMMLYRQHGNNEVGATEDNVFNKLTKNLNLLFSGKIFREKKEWANVPIELANELVSAFKIPEEYSEFLSQLASLKHKSKLKKISFYKKHNLISNKKPWNFLYL